MSYPIRAAAGSHDPTTTPAPPTTATVLDFICLFTHDLRRKQKRWQDGKLKFHTFNKRFMVYDDRGNFVGDGHWQGDVGEEFDEGLELELDRGAAIVQVAECVGSREQDLTEMLDKRAREVEKRRATAAARTPARTPVMSAVRHDSGDGVRPHLQPMHRSLSALVPNSGPIGRAAISDRSPYESRNGSSTIQYEQTPRAPPAKKRRVEESPPSKRGHAQSLFGTRLTLTASSAPYSSFRSNPAPPLRDRTNELQSVRAQELDKENSQEDVVMVESSPEPVESSKPAAPVSKSVPRRREQVHNVEKHIRQEVHEDQYAKKMVERVSLARERRERLENRDKSEDSEDEVLVASTPPEPKEDLRRVTAETTVRPKTNLGKRDKSSTKEAQQAKRHGSLGITDDMEIDQKVVAKATATKVKRQDPTRKRAKTSRRRASEESDDADDGHGDEEPAVQETKTQETRKKPAKPARNEKNSLKQKAKEIQESGSKERLPDVDTMPPESKEPRTELRIKPRQRRGLLMLSEAKNAVAPPPRPLPKAPEPSTSNLNDPADVSNFTEKDINCATAGQHPSPPLFVQDDPLKLSDESDVPVRKRTSKSQNVGREKTADDKSSINRRSKKKSTEIQRPTVSISSDDESEGPTTRVRKSSRGNAAEHEEDNDSLTSRPRRATRVNGKPKPNPFLSDDDSESSSSRRSMSKDPPLKTKDMESDEPSGPRIAKMNRKSVKCKEIFGFVVPGGDDIVNAPFVSVSTRQISVKPSPAASNNIKVERSPKAAEESEGILTSSDKKPQIEVTGEPEEIIDGGSSSRSQDKAPDAPNQEAQASASSKPRIMNPATRGKKAARKEHAAGQVPQCVVPFEPAVPVIGRPRSVATENMGGNTKALGNAAAANSGSNIGISGFSKANGGAWSKHAEDLLGMTRPVGGRR